MKKRIPAMLLALCLALSLLPMTVLADNSNQISSVKVDLATNMVFLGSSLPQATTETPNVSLRTEWRYCPQYDGGIPFEGMEVVTNGTASKLGWYWAQVTITPNSGYEFTADCVLACNGSTPEPLASFNPGLFAVEAMKRPPLLDTLSLSSGTLLPSFDMFVLGDYRADVDGSVDRITVTAATQPGYTIKGDGVRSLNVGENIIQITVTDGSGEYEPSIYTIRVNRAQPVSVDVPAFTDVPAGQFYTDAVNWAVAGGITNGTSTTTFSPFEQCSQIQILTFLYRAARGADATATAADMDKAVEWAKEKGIIDGSFDRSKPCTRATAVSYIWQAFGKPDAEKSSFTDVPASAAYAKAVDWALANGVTNGTTETTFGPDEVCNRGQIVTFLHRAYVEEARLTTK